MLWSILGRGFGRWYGRRGVIARLVIAVRFFVGLDRLLDLLGQGLRLGGREYPANGERPETRPRLVGELPVVVARLDHPNLDLQAAHVLVFRCRLGGLGLSALDWRESRLLLFGRGRRDDPAWLGPEHAGRRGGLGRLGHDEIARPARSRRGCLRSSLGCGPGATAAPRQGLDQAVHRVRQTRASIVLGPQGPHAGLPYRILFRKRSQGVFGLAAVDDVRDLGVSQDGLGARRRHW